MWRFYQESLRVAAAENIGRSITEVSERRPSLVEGRRNANNEAHRILPLIVHKAFEETETFDLTC
jgi:hypothetical protein